MVGTLKRALPVPTTAEEFLSRPDNGLDEFIIRGELWSKPVTYRNVFHSQTMARLCFLLMQQLEAIAPLRFRVVAGESEMRLRNDPLTIFGVDVAVFDASTPTILHGGREIFDGPPLLAIEIPSPSDRLREIQSKIDEYLATGTPLVWIVDPHYKTVVVHRPGEPSQLFSIRDIVSTEPVVPGLSIPVEQVFQGLPR